MIDGWDWLVYQRDLNTIYSLPIIATVQTQNVFILQGQNLVCISNQVRSQICRVQVKALIWKFMS